MQILKGNMRPLEPREFNKSKTRKIMRSSVTLPSQYQSYSICTQFAKEWFLDKFNDKYFNSVYVSGKHSFDEFRKFSSEGDKLTRTNPILAIMPNIDPTLNRNWIDSSPEFPMMLRRSRMDGTFYNDYDKGLHLQIVFKTIVMQFAFKMRVNTRAEQLDLCEFVKLKHRSGFTETKDLCLDVHVPREIIAQIAIDNGFKIDENLNVLNAKELLRYLNSRSFIPFIYKLRCSNGNHEFFIKVPNCVAHIKTELPSIDDGERKDMIQSNYAIDFNIEVEMTAPYAYTYYSQFDQKYINNKTINSDGSISVMKAIKTDIPDYDEHKWRMVSTAEYMVEENDLDDKLCIDMGEYFKNTELNDILSYTKYIKINPAVFINFKIYNDGIEQTFSIDWDTLKISIEKITNRTTVIAVYCDMEYINNTLLHIKDLESSRLH